MNNSMHILDNGIGSIDDDDEKENVDTAQNIDQNKENQINFFNPQ